MFTFMYTVSGIGDTKGYCGFDFPLDSENSLLLLCYTAVRADMKALVNAAWGPGADLPPAVLGVQ